MRNDFASFGRKAGKLYSARERGLNRGNRLSIELDEMPPDQAKAMPTSHVRQQTRRYWRWRLTFVRYSLTLGETIKDALIKIDERAPFCTNGRRSRDGACARARINPNKNKAIVLVRSTPYYIHYSCGGSAESCRKVHSFSEWRIILRPTPRRSPRPCSTSWAAHIRR